MSQTYTSAKYDCVWKHKEGQMTEKKRSETDVHNFGLNLLYSSPRLAMSFPVMMKFAARRNVGVIIVQQILLESR